MSPHRFADFLKDNKKKSATGVIKSQAETVGILRYLVHGPEEENVAWAKTAKMLKNLPLLPLANGGLGVISTPANLKNKLTWTEKKSASKLMF